MDKVSIEYDPSPTLDRFHQSSAFVRGVMGPIGSGKSVACTMEMLYRGLSQRPGPTGQRLSRWAVIRSTYPELRSTTIKTFQDWLPHNICPIKWDAPITATLRIPDPSPDATESLVEFIFLSIDRPADIKKLLSLELTGAWLNEARELRKDTLDMITGRVGRYPSMRDGGPSWSGVIMDSNPPDDDHWWYRAAEEETPEGWAFFRQPGALLDRGNGRFEPNPIAENVQHHSLGYDYWLRQLPGKTREWIKVYVLGDYGTIAAGKPVYASSWSDHLHVSDISPVPGELLIGWDFGLHPSVAIAQLTPRGRLAVLDEVVGDNIGVRQFAEGFVLPLLKSRYGEHPAVHIGDPAGSARSEVDERSAFDELRSLGVRIQPAPSNNPLKRWEAVRWYLSQLREGTPVLRLSPRCKTLRKGFNGGYRFRELQVSGGGKYSEKADKNEFSHVHDALQYICLYLREGTQAQKPIIRPRVTIADTVAGF